MSGSSLTSGWHIVGASVAGTSHQKTGRACEDFHAFKQQPDGVLLLAVADGAGTADRGAEGAKWAVCTALETASAALIQQPSPVDETQWQAFLNNILQTSRTALEALTTGDRPFLEAETVSLAPPHPTPSDEPVPLADAEKPLEPAEESAGIVQPPPTRTEPGEVSPPVKMPLRVFATTLQLAIVNKQWVAVLQIGDGAVVIQKLDGSLRSITVPDHGEYINETSFITDASYLKHVQYATLLNEEVQAIALFTDGIEMVALDFPSNEPYEPFFKPLFAFAAKPESSEAELSAFLQSERVCERTNDDKTLLIAARL